MAVIQLLGFFGDNAIYKYRTFSLYKSKHIIQPIILNQNEITSHSHGIIVSTVDHRNIKRLLITHVYSFLYMYIYIQGVSKLSAEVIQIRDHAG